ncbi:MAG: 2-oxoglutarate dehydrogenase complex dihydrolipoyllysine-residue succinyltransferase [Hyphomonas sp.]|nr:2-oxoglutarate dehydrogenase complex dihydrolipoyllysine-residue succinyltransferase [Hyphomonas sp.]
MTDITVPTLGESITEATVGQWLKAAGDIVKKDEVLVELETDKVSVEVSAPEDGVLSDILAGPGDTVEIGALLGRIGGNGAAKAAPASAPAKAEAKPAAAPAAGGAMTDITVPVMGESVAEGTLSALLKKPGEAVKKDETIAEIETDKVALEVPAPADGVIAEWLVREGSSVTPGTVIGRVSASGAAVASAPAAAPAPKAAAAEGRPVAPSVRRIATEAGVDAQVIPGTGRDGRATKADALAYVNAPKAPAAAPAEARTPRETGPREERVRMTRLRQTIARRLKEAQDTAAMLTTFNDVDMGAIMDLRKKHQDSFVAKHGIKLGFMSFFVKACVNALKEVPAVNAEIDGQDLIYKNFYDIGVAVGTDKGLVVPVVRDSDALSLAGIEKAIADLGRKARDGELTIGDMQGGTFTISNGGIYGSLMSTPILNPPQSGVLGMHRIEQRPVAINGQVVIRPMMYLALSYDHRIVDGKEAVTFLVRVKEALEDPERMLLEV